MTGVQKVGAELETPVLLLAMPQVLDPFFHRSVVLLIQHSDEGSLGFIVNRPTEIPLTEILTGMEIAWQGDSSATAFFGGPVQSQLGTVMFGPGEVELEAAQDSTAEVVPGIRISQHLGDLGRLASRPPESFRLFLGYAGWGAGQLIEEIVRNDWLMAPARRELLFCDQPESAWETALASVGVDPATLPSWTAGGADNGAN